MVAMASNAFIVDRKLGAVPVARLLDVRAQLRVSGNTGHRAADSDDGTAGTRRWTVARA